MRKQMPNGRHIKYLINWLYLEAIKSAINDTATRCMKCIVLVCLHCIVWFDKRKEKYISGMFGHTSRYSEHPHDPDDGGVDGKGGVDFNLLQSDAHYRQQHYSQVQLIPPKRADTQNKSLRCEM